MNGRMIKAVFFIPNVFTSVFTPVILSAFASVTSFVAIPPIRYVVAIVPIINGVGDVKGFPNTLHAAIIPSNPRGMATQIWFMNRYFFILGGSEYVTVKIIIRNMKNPNHAFIVTALKSANKYNMYAMLCAVSTVIIPLGIGLYGFDILSASRSAAWFNAFDAAFTIAIVNPA